MTEKLIETITEAIQDKKGRRIMIADLRELDGTICNYFVICEGSSPMQVEAIAGSVGDFARERCGEKPVNGDHGLGVENVFQYTLKYKGRLKEITEFENIVIRAKKDATFTNAENITKENVNITIE